jgi:hypothetical protein
MSTAYWDSLNSDRAVKHGFTLFLLVILIEPNYRNREW